MELYTQLNLLVFGYQILNHWNNLEYFMMTTLEKDNWKSLKLYLIYDKITIYDIIYDKLLMTVWSFACYITKYKCPQSAVDECSYYLPDNTLFAPKLNLAI